MKRRPQLTILVKLLVAFVVPTLVLFAGFAFIAYDASRGDLEAELGTRLTGIASSAATHVRERLAELGPGDEEDASYDATRRKLLAVVEATGAARIHVFDAELTSRCDTQAEVPIGATYYQLELDRYELARVFGEGRPMSSVLFEGRDGALYKAGYAPVPAPPGAPGIVMAVGVEAPADFFTRLSALRRTLILSGALLALVVLASAVLMATLITRPVRRLADAAERIGRGDLTAPVEQPSTDEIGFLARTLEEMRRALKERDERMQLMLSGIAHEVRNPLGGIELFAGILREEIEPGDDRRKHVARIEKELAYLKAVVSDFLEYARRTPPCLAPVDLGELCGELLELVRPDADAGKVELRSDADGLRCLADEGQLRRALLNIIRNAVQASAGTAEAAVTVRAEAAADDVVIEVHNNGPPIPADVAARIFEPFFTTREKGTGLGLAFVAEIARDHGGTITVQSEPARGTTFALRLRRAKG